MEFYLLNDYILTLTKQEGPLLVAMLKQGDQKKIFRVSRTGCHQWINDQWIDATDKAYQDRSEFDSDQDFYIEAFGCCINEPFNEDDDSVIDHPGMFDLINTLIDDCLNDQPSTWFPDSGPGLVFDGNNLSVNGRIYHFPTSGSAYCNWDIRQFFLEGSSV